MTADGDPWRVNDKKETSRARQVYTSMMSLADNKPGRKAVLIKPPPLASDSTATLAWRNAIRAAASELDAELRSLIDAKIGPSSRAHSSKVQTIANRLVQAKKESTRGGGEGAPAPPKKTGVAAAASPEDESKKRKAEESSSAATASSAALNKRPGAPKKSQLQAPSSPARPAGGGGGSSNAGGRGAKGAGGGGRGRGSGRGLMRRSRPLALRLPPSGAPRRGGGRQ